MGADCRAGGQEQPVKFGGEIPLDYLLVRLLAACPWCDDPRGSEVVLALRDLVPGRKRYRGVNVRAAVSQPPRRGEAILWLRSVVGVKDQIQIRAAC